MPSNPKKAGRPTTDPATHRGRATFTLSPTALRLVEQIHQRTGQSKSAIVEQAIRKLAEQEAPDGR